MGTGVTNWVSSPRKKHGHQLSALCFQPNRPGLADRRTLIADSLEYQLVAAELFLPEPEALCADWRRAKDQCGQAIGC
jgi:hypothetical protein